MYLINNIDQMQQLFNKHTNEFVLIIVVEWSTIFR